MKFSTVDFPDDEEINAAVHKELDRALSEINVLGMESRERCVMAAFDRLEPVFKKKGVDIKNTKDGRELLVKAMKMELENKINKSVKFKDINFLFPNKLTDVDPKSYIGQVHAGMMPAIHAGRAESFVVHTDSQDEAIELAGMVPKIKERALSALKETNEEDKRNKILDLIGRMNSNEAELRSVINEMFSFAGFDFDYSGLCDWAKNLARNWQAPLKPDTPNNLEAIAMNVIHMTCAISDKIPRELLLQQEKSNEVINSIWQTVGDNVPEFDRCAFRCKEFYNLPGLQEHEGDTTAFSEAWRESSYAKLEIGHKLAASLCLTDIGQVEVMAPWKACSIIVPDGVLELRTIKISRIWCVGNEPKFVIFSNAEVHRVFNPEGYDWRGLAQREGASDDLVEELRALGVAMWNLVRGAFMALANPEEFKKTKSNSSSSSHKTKRQGTPDFSQVRYMLSAPVQVDLREVLKEHLQGKRKGGGPPKVQFLVRGHWRKQAHGPGRGLRKTIWIQPFMKGDPAMRVLLRNYSIKDSDDSSLPSK